ncbi:MAG: hypothetical protein LBH73_01920 [Spirochaetaceae bacterium]|nr:hypothetical protein [Spirochaetaceae bacterium]
MFFIFPLCCGALEEFSLQAGSGTLWVEEQGAAWYWYSGLSCRPFRQFHLEAAAGGLNSSLPWVKTDLSLFRFKTGADFDRFGLHVSGALIVSNRFELDIGGIQMYNEGGRANFFNFSLPFYLGPFTLSPSFLTGHGYLRDGSLYWFFGKPLIPSVYCYGLAAGYNETWLLELRYLDLRPEIRSNEGDLLFTAALGGFLASYTFRLGPRPAKPEEKRRRFEGTAGWFYSGGSAEGALNASNQRYALFPFNFFSVTGSLDAHIAYGLVRLLFRPSIFRLDISLGAAHILWGEAKGGYHFKMKGLFGGSEFEEELDPVELGNTGAAFLLLDGGIVLRSPSRPAPRLVSLGVRKALAFPWAYEKFIPGAASGTDSAGSSPAPDPELLRSLLLSGLSLYARISR